MWTSPVDLLQNGRLLHPSLFAEPACIPAQSRCLTSHPSYRKWYRFFTYSVVPRSSTGAVLLSVRFFCTEAREPSVPAFSFCCRLRQLLFPFATAFGFLFARAARASNGHSLLKHAGRIRRD